MNYELLFTVITAALSAVGAIIAAYFSYRSEQQKTLIQTKTEEWRIVLDSAAQNIQQLRERVRHLEQQYDALAREINDERKAWADERIKLVSEYEAKLITVYRELTETKKMLHDEINEYREKYNTLITEHAGLQARYSQLLEECETLQKTVVVLREENDKLRALLHKRRKTDQLDAETEP
jgi:chromosome segregation ATPase